MVIIGNNCSMFILKKIINVIYKLHVLLTKSCSTQFNDDLRQSCKVCAKQDKFGHLTILTPEIILLALSVTHAMTLFFNFHSSIT